jgi:SulP family sulfate permease
MGEWETFETLLKSPKSDAIVFLVTFILTIFLDLVVAIGVGMVLASFLFMRKMADITEVKYILDDDEDKDANEFIENVKMPEHISIYEISGSFFFGAANKFVSAMREMGVPPRILIVKMSKVPFMDATAYHSLRMLYDFCRKNHTKVIILKIQEQPLTMLKKYGFVETMEAKNFCDTVEQAIERANIILNKM